MSASPPTSARARASRCCEPSEAYKIAALNAAPINALEALYLATLGGAEALGLEDRIGSLQAGREADILVLDPEATPLLAFRESRSRSLEEALFVLITLGDDRAVRATYVAGALAHARAPIDPRPAAPMVSP